MPHHFISAARISQRSNLQLHRQPQPLRLWLVDDNARRLHARVAALAAEHRQLVHRIDLRKVASKYIGETEKNLSRLLDRAEEPNAFLFFDEADALFGRRTEVKDSHDRYANIEISHLLQRIERSRATIVLGSRKRNLDESFLRRLRFVSVAT
jgi:SpoVK/Ycf46/Vps4 family AAA+-type ATPase